ncbi:MAG TPA: PTS sugar transporter subunit IIB [Chloroflexi bacterium]|jgi:PTS system mannose-specific IIB component|nr:PTS sugar transporter subunit IIB [Chloroflexota bacterium]
MPTEDEDTELRWERLALVRVDDRFLHGQVTLNWARALRPQRIVIADDTLAGDELGRAALRAAQPPGIDIWVGAVGEAASAFLDGRLPLDGTIVLVRDPQSARRLFDSGIQYERLNVGAVGGAPDRARIGQQVSVSRIEWEALRYLERAGVDVELQALPSDGAVTLAKVRQPREWAD